MFRVLSEAKDIHLILISGLVVLGKGILRAHSLLNFKLIALTITDEQTISLFSKGLWPGSNWHIKSCAKLKQTSNVLAKRNYVHSEVRRFQVSLSLQTVHSHSTHQNVLSLHLTINHSTARGGVANKDHFHKAGCVQKRYNITKYGQMQLKLVNMISIQQFL